MILRRLPISTQQRKLLARRRGYSRSIPRSLPRMNAATPNRVEHQLTDKGYVPVYTTAVVEQPWASYSGVDHEVWATLFKRQREVLVGRASDEFLRTQAAMG